MKDSSAAGTSLRAVIIQRRSRLNQPVRALLQWGQSALIGCGDECALAAESKGAV